MIGVCGYGITGSDAVLNLLKEYDGLKIVADREFLLTYFPYGIEDLEFHLMEQTSKFFSSDIAFMNFRKMAKSLCHNEKSYYYKLTDGHFNEFVEEYLNNITQVKYDGYWMYDYYVFDSLFKKIVYAIKGKIKSLNKYQLRKMNVSLRPTNFYNETKKFLKKVYNYDNYKGTIILDQPFPANDPLRSMRLFGDDSKAIILLRDPRDIYIQAVNKRKYKNRTLWAPGTDVDSFINFYKGMFSNKAENENIIYLYLEDMIYKYDETVKKIEEFCGIDSSKHKRKGEVFSIEKSMKNTRLFDRYPEFKDDIKRIENEMSEFLYDYTKLK